MKTFIMLLAGLLLTVQLAFAGFGNGQAPNATPAAPAQQGWQLAQHECGAYGKANRCKAHWDRRSKSCVCSG